MATTETSTRERILDVALDLFVEQGYEATSLRQIAEEMGFTKAALYYHFASKDDLLFALHLRLHAFSERALRGIDGSPRTAEEWCELLESLVDEAIANRKIILLHQRNPAAINNIQGKHDEHGAEHADMSEVLLTVFGDETLPVRTRVRVSSALGSLFAALALGGGASDLPVDEMADELRLVIREILLPRAAS